MGYVPWDTAREVHVKGVPQYFVLDQDLTVLAHAGSWSDTEIQVREIMDERLASPAD